MGQRQGRLAKSIRRSYTGEPKKEAGRYLLGYTVAYGVRIAGAIQASRGISRPGAERGFVVLVATGHSAGAGMDG